MPMTDGHSSECLQSQHLGGRGKMIRSSRSSSTGSKFKDSLGYLRACPNIQGKINPLRITCATLALRILSSKANLGYSETLFPKRNPKPHKPVREARSTYKTKVVYPKNATGGTLHHQCPSWWWLPCGSYCCEWQQSQGRFQAGYHVGKVLI